MLPVLTEIKATGEIAPVADVQNDCLMCQRATAAGKRKQLLRIQNGKKSPLSWTFNARPSVTLS
jgi:hypothetical protein